MGLADGDLVNAANDRRDQGETVMFVILNGEIAGLVSVADPIKQSTPKVLTALHKLGFRIIMVTGDNERTDKAVAKRLNIDEIRADVLPQDKARIVKELQDQGNQVAMAGDGVLYPFFGILIGPIFAAFAMSSSSLSVALNALRLRTANI